jgi:hypothetical protein
MPNDIQHHYQGLQKQHKLPEFALVDKEFEISNIDKPGFLLRNIRRKISERLDDVTQFLEPFVQPDANSFTSLFEYRALSEADRREVLKQFQHLMALYRSCIDAELSVDDAQDAAIIARIINEWPAIRAALRPIVQKVAASWPKPLERKDVVGYFG